MITTEEVQHIAKLARIELTAEETEMFQKDFSQILESFGVLASLDVSGLPAMTHSVLLENVAREDTPQKERAQVVEKLVLMAPATEQGFLKVQEVFQQGKKK